MNIEINSSKQISDWSIEHFYKLFFKLFSEKHKDHNVVWFNNSTPGESKNPGGPHSPHILTVKNLDNNKYIIISYWDNSSELLNSTWSNYGELVQIITSSGLHNEFLESLKTTNSNILYTPYTYLPYKYSNENFADEFRKPFNEKENNKLFFRGALYGNRKSLYEVNPKIFGGVIDQLEYYNEINKNKISLSLDGAGIICNRDIEILSLGSVLFRPISNIITHNQLIDGIHYIGFEKTDNPNTQNEIILEKYNQIKDDEVLLSTVSHNGLEWYVNNGTVLKNVEISIELINIDILK